MSNFLVRLDDSRKEESEICTSCVVQMNEKTSVIAFWDDPKCGNLSTLIRNPKVVWGIIEVGKTQSGTWYAISFKPIDNVKDHWKELMQCGNADWIMANFEPSTDENAEETSETQTPAPESTEPKQSRCMITIACYEAKPRPIESFTSKDDLDWILVAIRDYKPKTKDEEEQMMVMLSWYREHT